jgi:hypothetical protein
MLVKMLKLMQTFVMKKFLLLMALPGLKWMFFLMFHLSSFSTVPPAAGVFRLPTSDFIHPFYVSVTEFNHNTKDKTIEISCKMFAEDFENALKTQFKTNVDISHPKDPKVLEKLVFEYLQKHLQLKVNGKPVSLQFVGYEKEEEAVWTYLQVNNVASLKKIEITNNILYEAYNTQISIMHASEGGNRKSTRLVYPDTQASFEW